MLHKKGIQSNSLDVCCKTAIFIRFVRLENILQEEWCFDSYKMPKNWLRFEFCPASWPLWPSQKTWTLSTYFATLEYLLHLFHGSSFRNGQQNKRMPVFSRLIIIPLCISPFEVSSELDFCFWPKRRQVKESFLFSMAVHENQPKFQISDKSLFKSGLFFLMHSHSTAKGQ